MHFEAEALEHTKKRDTGHQSVSLDNKTGDSTVLKIGNSAKSVIKQDMKGRKHKYGFNNNKREKIEKKNVVDDETDDKHELYEKLFRLKAQCDSAMVLPNRHTFIGATKPYTEKGLLFRCSILRLVHVDTSHDEEIADTAMTLFLGLFRRTHLLSASGWLGSVQLLCRGIRRCSGLVLGIVRISSSARSLATGNLAFKMSVLYFDARASLDGRQREAACTDISTPLMIVAGPGSGKGPKFVAMKKIDSSKAIKRKNLEYGVRMPKLSLPLKSL
ncbi:hypothetical protein JHK82_012564 [Glycine max]|nr:hypothetical protein JHK82_012564 [Glycine max]